MIVCDKALITNVTLSAVVNGKLYMKTKGETISIMLPERVRKKQNNKVQNLGKRLRFFIIVEQPIKSGEVTITPRKIQQFKVSREFKVISVMEYVVVMFK